jgi:site-specific recombinase XerD
MHSQNYAAPNILHRVPLLCHVADFVKEKGATDVASAISLVDRFASPSELRAPDTLYLEREEIEAVFKSLPRNGPIALRDRALLMLVYNSGARVQEIADLHVVDVDLDGCFACGPKARGTSGEAVLCGLRLPR